MFDKNKKQMAETSTCWNCSRVVSTLECPSCGAIASTKSYYKRASILEAEEKRHQELLEKKPKTRKELMEELLTCTYH